MHQSGGIFDLGLTSMTFGRLLIEAELTVFVNYNEQIVTSKKHVMKQQVTNLNEFVVM